jgi:hypothetical protein
MYGSDYKREKGDQRSYLCSNFNKFGTGNPTGCRSHRVSHRTLEEYVKRFLDEGDSQLAAIRSQEDNISGNLVGEAKRLMESGAELRDRVRKFVEDAIGANHKILHDMDMNLDQISRLPVNDPSKPNAILLGLAWTGGTMGYLFNVYEAIYKSELEALEAQVQAKRNELLQMIKDFRDLQTPLAKKIANEQISEIEAEIMKLEVLLEPLGDLRESWNAEVNAALVRMKEAKEAMRGRDNRRKAEAIRQVVSKIVCHFDYKQHGQQTRSVLTKVDIETVNGESDSLSNGTWPGPG